MIIKICMVILAVTQVLILRRVSYLDDRHADLVKAVFAAEVKVGHWQQTCIELHSECNRLQEELVKAKFSREE